MTPKAKQKEQEKQEKVKEGLEKYRVETQTGTGRPNDDEKEVEQALNTGGLSEGISAEKMVDIVVGMVMPLIDTEQKKIAFERDYRMRTQPALELIEVEELTKGMSAGEMPEWARWTILFLALTVPAFIGIKKHTSLLEKLKPKKSKRKKEREKDKKRIEKENNEGKEG